MLKKVSSVKEFKNLKCSHMTIVKKKWPCLGIYWPPTHENLVCFFEELTDSLSKGSNFMKTLSF